MDDADKAELMVRFTAKVKAYAARQAEELGIPYDAYTVELSFDLTRFR